MEGNGSRAKSIGIWTAIGAGVGTGVGVALLAATGGSDDGGKVVAPFILGGAGLGAVIGAVIGTHAGPRVMGVTWQQPTGAQ